MTVSFAFLVVVPSVAEMVATLFEVTVVVVMEKEAVSAPAGIVALTGTAANAESEVRETVMPPAGAGLLIVTVPVLPAAPVTEVGLTARLVKSGAFTVSFAVLVTVPRLPVRVATPD